MSLETLTKVYELEPGIAGTKQTLAVMRAQLVEALRDPEQKARRCCVAILDSARARGGNEIAEAHALFDWVVRNVTFRRDGSEIERTQHPWVLLAQVEQGEPAAGDCNNQANLIATLGHTVSLPIVWILIGKSPDEYRHIYPAMDLTGGGQIKDIDRDLLALDTATEVPTFGVHTQDKQRWVVDAFVGF